MSLGGRIARGGRKVKLFAPAYVPGAGVPAGATFARAGEGTQTAANGNLGYVAAGVMREAHYIGGVRTLLLEPSATNLCPYSSPADVTAGRWQSFLSLAQAAVAGPDGIVDSAKQWHQNTANTDAAWYLPLGALPSAQYRVSSYLKNAVDGPVRRRHHMSATNTIYSPDFITSAVWQRFSGVLAAFTGAYANMGYRGGSTGNNLTVQCFGYMVQPVGELLSSYVRTNGAAVVRPADALSFPQPGTLYEKYINAAGAVVETVRAYLAGSSIGNSEVRGYTSIKLGLGTYSIGEMRAALV